MVWRVVVEPGPERPGGVFWTFSARLEIEYAAVDVTAKSPKRFGSITSPCA